MLANRKAGHRPAKGPRQVEVGKLEKQKHVAKNARLEWLRVMAKRRRAL
jgi:hypothetical protein